MNTIYEIIRQNPDYFAWIFGIVNALWGAFLYFNKKRHGREIETLRHSLNLDLEKRKRMHEMKAAQFEKYFRMADEFGKKHRVDPPRKLQPIFNDCMSSYLPAEDNGDKKASTEAIV